MTPPRLQIALPRRAPSASLSPQAAFYLQASITTSFLAGSSAPTPLYRLYQAEWGFSPVMVTVVFGVYAIAVLAALLLGGRLSDHVGRRPVLLAAALAQTATMALFATADSVGDLLAARVLQGLSTGVAVAAAGAALLDIDKARGTIANAIAPLVGTAVGGVIAGVMARYLPAPTELVYVVLGLVFLAQAAGMARVAETGARRPGVWASLKPQIGLPESVRGPMLLAIPVLVAAWALGGFYASLGPTLVRTLAATDSTLVGSLALFVMAGFGSVAVLVLRHQDGHAMMRFGAAGLLAGVSIALLALEHRSTLAFFVGTAIAGAGFGPAFQGAVRAVVPLAGPRERAGVLAVIFVVSYLALGLPAIAAGWLVAHNGSIFATARDFGGIVIGLAGMAFLGLVRARRAGLA